MQLADTVLQMSLAMLDCQTVLENKVLTGKAWETQKGKRNTADAATVKNSRQKQNRSMVMRTTMNNAPPMLL